MHISFIQDSIKNLALELSKAFAEFSLVYPNNTFVSEARRWPSSITLWDSVQQGLRIRPSMYDVTDRMEVGVLSFEIVKKHGSEEVFYSLPESFSKGTRPQKLVIEESGYVIESGLRIEADNGDSIVIVPNTMPFSLAVYCTGIELNGFESEYDLEEYESIELR